MGIVYSIGGKLYDYLDNYYEKSRYFKIRKDMLKNLKGKILDAGCGTGRNFEHYNKKSHVIGVDLSDNMLSVANKRIKKSKAKIKVRKMNLSNIEFKENTFDFVVSSFVLGVVPKSIERKALGEIIRVVKPKGEIYILEYVYSKNNKRKFLMRITSFIPRILYSLRFDSVLRLLKDVEGIKIKEVKFVFEDIVRLVVIKKLDSLKI